MKNVITTTLAVALLAASSMAFAADNGNGNGNGGKNGNNSGITDAAKTGSIKNGTETPDQADIDRCKMAPANDPTCVGVPKQ